MPKGRRVGRRQHGLAGSSTNVLSPGSARLRRSSGGASSRDSPETSPETEAWPPWGRRSPRRGRARGTWRQAAKREDAAAFAVVVLDYGDRAALDDHAHPLQLVQVLPGEPQQQRAEVRRHRLTQRHGAWIGHLGGGGTPGVIGSGAAQRRTTSPSASAVPSLAVPLSLCDCGQRDAPRGRRTRAGCWRCRGR